MSFAELCMDPLQVSVAGEGVLQLVTGVGELIQCGNVLRSQPIQLRLKSIAACAGCSCLCGHLCL